MRSPTATSQTRRSTWLRPLATTLGAAVALSLTSIPPALAAGGDWLPGFNSGAPIVQLPATDVDAPAVASAKALTYVASDSFPSIPGTTIQRFLASGSPDTTWSGDGVLDATTVPQVLDLHPNADGTLLIGGLDASGDALVGQLRANGTWDTAFGRDGRVVLPIDSSQGVRSLAVDSRGRVLAAITSRRTNIELKSDFVVVRLLRDGRIDRSFGVAGYATVDTRRVDSVRAVATDGDDRVLVMGATDNDPNTPGYSALVVRLNRNGSLDTTYGNRGRVFPSYRSSTGQVVVSGHADNRGRLTVALGTDGGDYAVTRLTDKGRTDRAFGTNGRTGVTCGCTLLGATWSRGMVMAVSSPDATALRTVKVTASGAFAGSWGTGGTADTPLPTGVTLNGTSLAAGPRGSVVVGGQGFQDDGLGNLAAALLVGRLSGR